jgi:hypothetical protein
MTTNNQDNGQFNINEHFTELMKSVGLDHSGHDSLKTCAWSIASGYDRPLSAQENLTTCARID